MIEIPDRLAKALADRYRIQRLLGEGGMATVYLADDLKHDRRVALKVLKPELAAVIGGERFVQEIKVTANLQHPNILALYDSGEVDSFLYYVMPYVEGETLRDRLDREKQLSVEQSVEIAKAVASALDYAHRHGVVHRDIKPANILLHEDQPLVADFGIALAISAAGGNRYTETGLSIGTPHYMSPEQATADRELDARSDVYSLGVLLYEMLVGQPPFMAAAAQAVVAKILTEEPPPVSAARRSVPPHIDACVRKAMAKLPADRFRTAQDFGRALGDVTFAGTMAADPAGSGAGTARSSRLAWAVAAVMAVAAVIGWIGWLGFSPEPPPQVIRLMLSDMGRQPRGASAVRYGFALHPAGTGLVLMDSVDGTTALFFKPNDAIDPTQLAGTAGGFSPFFSPDGRWVGFFADGSVKKVSLTGGGGGAVTLASGANPSAPTGAWSNDGLIYFPGPRWALHRVSEDGGESEVVVNPREIGGRGALEPWPLPDGRGVLFSACTGGCVLTDVYVYDARADTTIRLIENARTPLYAPDGYVIYTSSDGGAFAAPLDLQTPRVTGGSIPILDGVTGAGMTLGSDGTLIYSVGADTRRKERLMWVARDGTETVVDSAWERQFQSPVISPDGESLVVTVTEDDGEENLWLKPVGRGPASKLTFGGADEHPAWTADGDAVAFIRDGDVYSVAISGTTSPAALILADSAGEITEVVYSSDSDWLVYRRGPSLYARDLASDSTILLVEEDRARQPVISPDGRWLAFASERSTRSEVYVRPFPDTRGAEWTVSTGGGFSPRWSHDGTEIFYRGEDGMLWSVDVVDRTRFAIGARRALFSHLPYSSDRGHQTYDVASDDSRFLMRRDVDSTGRVEIVWVRNWFEELRRKMEGK